MVHYEAHYKAHSVAVLEAEVLNVCFSIHLGSEEACCKHAGQSVFSFQRSEWVRGMLECADEWASLGVTTPFEGGCVRLECASSREAHGTTSTTFPNKLSHSAHEDRTRWSSK